MDELIWTWQSHQVSYFRVESQTCDVNGLPPSGRAVLCIHGFGASKGHWRHNLQALSTGSTVYAIDLLGFGASSKPLSRLGDEPQEPQSVRYCFDLWGQQIVDFCSEVIGAGSHTQLQLIGNSIGGVVALNAARMLEGKGAGAEQVVLIDCAERELDLKRLHEKPPTARWSRPILMALVRQRWLIANLFRFLARPSVVKAVLQQAYPTGRNVDDELIEILLRPSRDPGATESFRGFVNLFNDWLAPQLLQELKTPVRMLWGGADPWEPISEAERWLSSFDCIQELQILQGLGHCPHDEDPDRANPILQHWIDIGWRY